MLMCRQDCRPFLKGERRTMPARAHRWQWDRPSRPLPFRMPRLRRRMNDPESVLHRILRRRWKATPLTWERKKKGRRRM